MRHVYECHLRWADLDSLGHINNVVYVDYLQEARVSLMRAMLGERRDDLAEGVVVVRHEVTYLAPLGFRFEPVSIECWVTEMRAATFTMAYEVFHEQADGIRTVYLRATTVLTPYVFALERPRRLSEEEKAALAPYVEEPFGPRTTRIPPLERSAAHRFPLYVRFSDVDVYRHVNNVKYVEYLQEARIAIGDALWRDPDTDATGVVVGRAEVDYHRPMVLRPEPYTVLTTVSRLGTRSMDLTSEIRDHDALCARGRVVMVFFDREHGRSVEPSARLRRRLEEALARGRAY